MLVRDNAEIAKPTDRGGVNLNPCCCFPAANYLTLRLSLNWGVAKW